MKKFCLFALILFALTGCVQVAQSLVTSNGTETINETSAVYYASTEGIFLVVWHDFSRSMGSSGGRSAAGASSTGEKTEISGDYWIGDEKVFEYTCLTSDGKTGSIVFGEEKYDLAKGGMFLVKSAHDGYSVTQLVLPIVKTERFREDLESLVTSNPKITDFINEYEKS